MNDKIKDLILEAYKTAHKSPELRMSNYSNVDVQKLNDAMIKVHVLLEDICCTMEEMDNEN